MAGIQVAWEDVFSVVDLIRPQLIGIVIGLIVLIAVMIVAGKVKKGKRGFVRGQAGIAFVLFLTIMVNNICLGTLNNTLSMVFAETGVLREETAADSRQTVEEMQ